MSSFFNRIPKPLWILLAVVPVTIVAAVILQTNFKKEYSVLKRHVDRPESYQSSRDGEPDRTLSDLEAERRKRPIVISGKPPPPLVRSNFAEALEQIEKALQDSAESVHTAAEVRITAKNLAVQQFALNVGDRIESINNVRIDSREQVIPALAEFLSRPENNIFLKRSDTRLRVVYHWHGHTLLHRITNIDGTALGAEHNRRP